MIMQGNISLKAFNTFGIEVFAENFATFKSRVELQEIHEFTKKQSSGDQHSMILGGGSNILLTKNVPGYVLKNEIMGIEKVNEDADHIYLRAGAGENWHQLVLHCIANNYAGLENLSLIPGNVGASPMQNIGAYGVEIKDVFHSLEALSREENKIVVFDKDDCAFGYRESVFKNKYRNKFIITSVTYKLAKRPSLNTSYGAIEAELEKMKVEEVSIQAISQAVINIRSSKLPDPKFIGNAGSFFKNPEVSTAIFETLQLSYPNIVGYALPNGNTKLAAGWLIEQCGWKGYRKGDAGCHEKQALVLVNYGNASGADIFDLSTAIVDSVKDKFQIILEREVNII